MSLGCNSCIQAVLGIRWCLCSSDWKKHFFLTAGAKVCAQRPTQEGDCTSASCPSLEFFHKKFPAASRKNTSDSYLKFIQEPIIYAKILCSCTLVCSFLFHFLSCPKWKVSLNVTVQTNLGSMLVIHNTHWKCEQNKSHCILGTLFRVILIKVFLHV